MSGSSIEGVQIDHPDLVDNIWTNPFEIAGNRIDDDRNGYVDDIHGWDFNSGDATVYDGTGDDHGTHVAGTIGARGGNGIGVAGVDWNVTFIPVKFLGPSGGSISSAIAAIDYVSDLKTRHGLNIVATNNSWGYLHTAAMGTPSQALADAIDRGWRPRHPVHRCGGNDGNVDRRRRQHSFSPPATAAPLALTARHAAGTASIAVANITPAGRLATTLELRVAVRRPGRTRQRASGAPIQGATPTAGTSMALRT